MDAQFKALGLGKRVACSPHTFARSVPRRNPRSIYALFIDRIIPETVSARRTLVPALIDGIVVC